MPKSQYRNNPSRTIPDIHQILNEKKSKKTHRKNKEGGLLSHTTYQTVSPSQTENYSPLQLLTSRSPLSWTLVPSPLPH